MPSQIPQPTIYLRNKFTIKPGLNGLFFKGKEALLTNLPNNVRLIAACGQQELLKGEPAPDQLPEMMHIWQLPEWSTLYRLMFTFSESDWYRSEVASLGIEHQDLLVGIGHGIETNPRPPAWKGKKNPGYMYVYDEVRLNPDVTTLTYLRHLNWFTSQLKDLRRDFSLQWIAAEITGVPSQVSMLWRVRDVKTLEDTFKIMAYDERYAPRYEDMMLSVKSSARQYMWPESTEVADNKLQKARAAVAVTLVPAITVQKKRRVA